MVLTASLCGGYDSSEAQMHLGQPPFWGHISLEHPNKRTQVSFLCGAEGATQWFHEFPGETSSGQRSLRDEFCLRRGPREGGLQPPAQSTLLPSACRMLYDPQECCGPARHPVNSLSSSWQFTTHTRMMCIADFIEVWGEMEDNYTAGRKPLQLAFRSSCS